MTQPTSTPIPVPVPAPALTVPSVLALITSLAGVAVSLGVISNKTNAAILAIAFIVVPWAFFAVHALVKVAVHRTLTVAATAPGLAVFPGNDGKPGPEGPAGPQGAPGEVSVEQVQQALAQVFTPVTPAPITPAPGGGVPLTTNLQPFDPMAAQAATSAV